MSDDFRGAENTVKLLLEAGSHFIRLKKKVEKESCTQLN